MSEVVVDTSAFVAIFKREPMITALRDRLAAAPVVLVPACCFVELALLRRLHPQLFEWTRDLCTKASYILLDLTVAEAELAVTAARRFGKGSGHPAQLNFGDCLVYAAAKHRDLPLLFAGEDFSKTDLKNALLREN